MGDRPGAARRLAAVAALIGLLAALGVIGYGLANGEVWRLAVVLVLLGAAVVGLWYVLSRRGGQRVFGAVVAALAAVGVLAITFTGEYRGLFVVLAAVLVVLSATAARQALQPARRQAAVAARPTLVVTTPSRHPVLIMNPKSGGGKAERFHLVDECRIRGIEPVVLGPDDDLARLAAGAISAGADIIGMAGGDGSQALVATLAAERRLPYVCVPAGTRNHFALDLGLDREDVVGAVDAYTDGVERRVDLARVNGRVFVNNACMGLYARIVQSDAYRDAKLKTTADMLPDMIGPGAVPFDLRFIGPDGERRRSAHLILVSNNPYQVDHLAGRG
ncbi:MAG TPA: diacylglycerol kinase family protein, partial [Acidimicrobiales bacterium]|nr:diacylglycerol kinase family protein [Acidimicrobiales bacterium]